MWAAVLSELAEVPVLVEWETVTWRVRWVDGPTRVQLLDRATALDGYGIGAPLPVAQMRFARRSSSAATAVGWLAHGSVGGTAAEYAVDLWCADYRVSAVTGWSRAAGGRGGAGGGQSGGLRRPGRFDDLRSAPTGTGRPHWSGHR